MFKQITDVPTDIRDFYMEVTQSEPKLDENGDQVYTESTETHQDENGDDVEVIAQTPVYEDVVYVVEKPRTEIKSMSDVWALVRHAKGTNDPLIRDFINMVNTGESWSFHDNYIVWLTELEFLKSLQVSDDPDTEDTDEARVHQDKIAYHNTLKPSKPSEINPDVWLRSNYADLRLAAYPPKEKQLEMQFDDGENGTSTWTDYIRRIKAQYPKP